MSSKRLEDYPDALTVEEAAAVLRIGRQAAYEAVRAGSIPSRKFGKRLIVPKELLRKLLAGEWPPAAPPEPERPALRLA
ncbi:MAG: helix-turn-helix domain-containing protein [Actinomycetota bacterium]